jgi:hypothetical protein
LHKLYPILFLALISSFTACKPRLEIDASRPRLQQKEAQMLYKRLGEVRHDFEWLSGKIDSEAILKGERNGFTTNFRLRQDSLLWLSISPALGIEVARVNITTDSVMFLNKINKTYLLGDYVYLQTLLKLDDLDYCLLQSILLGEPVLLDADERWTGEIDSNLYVLKNVPGKKLRRILGITRDEDFDQPADSAYLYDTVDRRVDRVLRKNKENDRYVKRYFLDDKFRLVKMLITDVPNNRLLEITYNEYQAVDSLMLPQRIHVAITDLRESIIFDLNYTKIKTETPQPVSFKIPEKYEPFTP